MTVDGNAAETINGVASVYLGPGESALLVSSGTAWNALVTRNFPNRVQTKSGGYVVVATDNGSWIQHTNAGTISLPAAATAGNGFKLGIIAGSGVVTVDPNGAELVNGQSTLALTPRSQVVLACDGSAWHALVTTPYTQEKVKTANEIVNNSTTLQDDDHLAGFELEADAYYRFSGLLRINGSVAADFTFALAFSDAPQTFLLLSSGGSTTIPGNGVPITFVATDAYLSFDGYVRANATTGGTMKMQWAQRQADVSDTTLYDGSWLSLTRVR